MTEVVLRFAYTAGLLVLGGLGRFCAAGDAELIPPCRLQPPAAPAERDAPQPSPAPRVALLVPDGLAPARCGLAELVPCERGRQLGPDRVRQSTHSGSVTDASALPGAGLTRASARFVFALNAAGRVLDALAVEPAFADPSVALRESIGPPAALCISPRAI